MITPDEEILICAVRYALTRMSYVVGSVIEYVYYKRKLLSKECRAIIVRDIHEHYQLSETLNVHPIIETDKNKWFELAEELKNVEHEGGEHDGRFTEIY